MKKLLAIALVVSATGCALFTKQNVKTALDVVEQACVLAHGELFDVKEVAAACGIAEALIPDLEKLLEARRRAAIARAKQAGVCP